MANGSATPLHAHRRRSKVKAKASRSKGQGSAGTKSTTTPSQPVPTTEELRRARDAYYNRSPEERTAASSPMAYIGESTVSVVTSRSKAKGRDRDRGDGHRRRSDETHRRRRPVNTKDSNVRRSSTVSERTPRRPSASGETSTATTRRVDDARRPATSEDLVKRQPSRTADMRDGKIVVKRRRRASLGRADTTKTRTRTESKSLAAPKISRYVMLHAQR